VPLISLDFFITFGQICFGCKSSISILFSWYCLPAVTSRHDRLSIAHEFWVHDKVVSFRVVTWRACRSTRVYNTHATTNHRAALAQVRRSLDDVIDINSSKQQCKRYKRFVIFFWLVRDTYDTNAKENVISDRLKVI